MLENEDRGSVITKKKGIVSSPDMQLSTDMDWWSSGLVPLAVIDDSLTDEGFSPPTRVLTAPEWTPWWTPLSWIPTLGTPGLVTYQILLC